MKKKSEIRSRLINSIKIILAVGAMIGICTFISKANQFDAYATESIQGTASALDWQVTVTPTVNGESNITNRTIKYNYEIYKADGSKETSYSDKESPLTSNNYKISGEYSNFYTLKLTGCTVDGISGSFTDGTVQTSQGDYDSSAHRITKTLTPTITVEFPYTLSWSVSVPVKEVKVNGTKVTTKNIKKISYSIKKGSEVIDTRELVLPSAAGAGSTITLTGDIAEGITDTGNYTLELDTCSVDVEGTEYLVEISGESNKATKSGTDWRISGNLSAISLNVSTLPSKYSKVDDGDYDEDDDHKDVGVTISSIKASKVKSILDYVYNKDINGLKSRIQEIMRNNETLSIAVSVTELSKSNVEDKGEYDPLKKKARSYDDADDAKLEKFFDISLYVTANDEFSVNDKITDAGESLTFNYKIPSEYKKGTSTSSSSSVKTVTSRYYNIFTYHDGAAHSTGNDYKKDKDSLSFEAQKFSTFTFAYYDKSSSSTSSSSSSSRTSNSSSLRSPTTGATSGNAAGGGTGGSRTGSGAPKTGDEFNAKLWIYFLVVGVVVALCAFILYQDTKDWRDEKKEAK